MHIEYYEVGTVAVDGWAAAFSTVPNVTAHPSTTGVPITLLMYMYKGPLLCGFNVPIKGSSANRRQSVAGVDCPVTIHRLTDVQLNSVDSKGIIVPH